MYNISVSQPAVYITKESRGSDHAVLNIRRLKKLNCIARRVHIVEVMSAMFTQAAWNGFHEMILEKLSDRQLCSDWGLSWAWCAMYGNCIVWYDQTIIHRNTRLIEKTLKSPNRTCEVIRSPALRQYIQYRWFRNTTQWNRKNYMKQENCWISATKLV
tara:strand:- start:1388 stop:1861 length:474 start_codon:yes stop_codon:yes gene_type:complete